MGTEKRLIAFDPVTFESFTRHCTKHREPYDQYDMGYVDAVDNIECWLEANTVDAVEVVRCKDCKYGDMCSIREAMAVSDWNAYCYRGERKDND